MGSPGIRILAEVRERCAEVSAGADLVRVDVEAIGPYAARLASRGARPRRGATRPVAGHRRRRRGARRARVGPRHHQLRLGLPPGRHQAAGAVRGGDHGDLAAGARRAIRARCPRPGSAHAGRSPPHLRPALRRRPGRRAHGLLRHRARRPRPDGPRALPRELPRAGRGRRPLRGQARGHPRPAALLPRRRPLARPRGAVLQAGPAGRGRPQPGVRRRRAGSLRRPRRADRLRRQPRPPRPARRRRAASTTSTWPRPSTPASCWRRDRRPRPRSEPVASTPSSCCAPSWPPPADRPRRRRSTTCSGSAVGTRSTRRSPATAPAASSTDQPTPRRPDGNRRSDPTPTGAQAHHRRDRRRRPARGLGRGRLHGRRRRRLPDRGGAGAARRSRAGQAHPRLVAARRDRRFAGRPAPSTACPPARPTHRRPSRRSTPTAPQHRPRGGAHPRRRPDHRRPRGRSASRRAGAGHDTYGAPMRQTFFRAGEVIIELVGPEEPATDGVGRRSGRLLRPGPHRRRPRRRRRPPGRRRWAPRRTRCSPAGASPRCATGTSGCRSPPP